MPCPRLAALLRVIAAVVAARDCAAQGADDPTVLDALRKVDSVYQSALTLEGTEVCQSDPLHPGDPGGQFTWRFTRNQDEMVLRRERKEVPTPIFVPKNTSPFSDYDENGNLKVRMLVEEVYHFSPEERFRLQRYIHYMVSPDGRAVSERPFESIGFYPADDPEPSLAIKRAFWSSGRDFGQFIEDVVESETRADGRVALRARGFESGASHGTWNLVLDPSQSYLVTEATYTRDGRSDPTISLENASSTGEGPCQVAHASKWRTNVGVTSEETIECDHAAFEIDEELLQVGRQAKQGPFLEDALGFDKRSGDVKVMNFHKSQPDDDPPSRNPGSRLRLFALILNGHLVLGLLAYFAYRKYRYRSALGGHV